MKRIFWLFIAFLISANHAAATDIDRFLGVWSVNVERTMEEAKASPKYNSETAEKDKKMLSRFAKALQLQITESTIVFVRGKKVQEAPYVVKSVSQSSLDAEATYHKQVVNLTFTLRDGNYLNMKSSDSDDFNVYIWEKTSDGKKVDSETRVITNILTDVINNN